MLKGGRLVGQREHPGGPVEAPRRENNGLCRCPDNVVEKSDEVGEHRSPLLAIKPIVGPYNCYSPGVLSRGS